MSKIYITYKPSEIVLEKLKSSGHDVVVSPLSEVSDACALITTVADKVNKKVLDQAGPSLKIVANCAVGFDNIDLKECAAKKIFTTNTPDVSSDTVGEHAIALMLSLAHRIPEGDRFMRAGKYKGWEMDLLLGTDLTGKVLGVVGLGRIGKACAMKASKGFSMKVLYYDIKRDENFEKSCDAEFKENPDEIFKEADFITLHLPYLPSTHHFVNKEKLSLMKTNSCIVNTSRGAVVNEEELTNFLKDKKIRGAALDVFEHEPNVSPDLAKLDNVILTPHIASATIETREKMSILASENVLAVLSGQPPLNPIRNL
jgi:glyoxylate reductase